MVIYIYKFFSLKISGLHDHPSYILPFIPSSQSFVPFNLFILLVLSHYFFSSSFSLILGFPMGSFPVGFFSSTMRINGLWFIYAWPPHFTLSFLVISAIFGRWYGDSNFLFILTFQSMITLSFSGSKIFLWIFLLNTRNLLSSVFRNVKVSTPPATIGPIKAVCNCFFFFKPLDHSGILNSFASPWSHLIPAGIIAFIFAVISLCSARTIPGYLNWFTLSNLHWTIPKEGFYHVSISLLTTVFFVSLRRRVNLFLPKTFPIDRTVTWVRFATLSIVP